MQQKKWKNMLCASVPADRIKQKRARKAYQSTHIYYVIYIGELRYGYFSTLEAAIESFRMRYNKNAQLIEVNGNQETILLGKTTVKGKRQRTT